MTQPWAVPSKRRERYQWCKFYYANSPTFAALVDAVTFGVCGSISIESKYSYLTPVINDIAKELILLGDVFIHVSELKNNDFVLKILDPNFVEVQSDVLKTYIHICPDESLKRLVSTKEPSKDYNKLPQFIIDSVNGGKSYPLQNTYHIANGKPPYGLYGVPIISYKDSIEKMSTELLLIKIVSIQNRISEFIDTATNKKCNIVWGKPKRDEIDKVLNSAYKQQKPEPVSIRLEPNIIAALKEQARTESFLTGEDKSYTDLVRKYVVNGLKDSMSI